MPHCRIYFFTYKRNQLLQRSLQSLIGQTFTDWVCEVHNDCPEDPFPEQYVNALADARFTIHNHSENLGAVRSFNLAFTGCAEEYASMLEDDNWWEPTFLEEMIALMDSTPSLKVLWSNMRLWKETEDNQWQDTGKTTWPVQPGATFFQWPVQQQAMSALHSTGAMLYRGIYAHQYHVPPETLLNAVELVRERSFEHPIAVMNKPLANFAVTRSTYRSADKWIWIASQLMMLASFILTAGDKETCFKESLSFYRQQKPTPVANFLLVNLFFLKDPKLLKYFSAKDWLHCLKWLTRNGYQLHTLKKYLNEQQPVYDFLLRHTAERYREALN